MAECPEAISCDALNSYIEVTKLIKCNPFGEYGLTAWPEIKPRGVRDKAYLILKKEGEPMHFKDITEQINEIDFGDKKQAQSQTVHNELIKDPRFKWVSRGIYSLG